MRIFNQSKNKLVSASATEAKNIVEKTIGLIGAKKAHALILKTRFGIHTFGLRFPIDCVVLDSEKKVVAKRESIRPLRFYFWNPKYDFVIELPEGTINKSKILVGDKLIINQLDKISHR